MSEYAKALTDFWSAQGKAVLDAQEKAARALTENMQAMLSGRMPSFAEAPGDAGALTAELTQAGDALMQLWSAAGSLSTELASNMGKYVGGAKDDTATVVLERMLDPRQWMAGTGELADVLARMAEGPRLADMWDVERRFARVMRAWTAMRRRALEHQGIALD